MPLYPTVIERDWIRGANVETENLRGEAFTEEVKAHTFVITGRDANRNALTLSGTVLAKTIRADNQTIDVTGSISDGKVSVTLIKDCYNVPGRLSIVIYLSDSTVTKAVYAAIMNVNRGTSGQELDSGTTVPSLQQLEAAYNYCQAATAAALDAAEFIPDVIAPAHDAESGVYAAGKYVSNDGKLYKAACNITAPEDFDAERWLHSDVGRELEARERGTVIYNNSGAYSHTGTQNIAPNLTIARSGNRYTFNGTVTNSSNALHVLFAKNQKIIASAYDSTRKNELVLVDGHTYELCIKYISGTVSHDTGTRIGTYASFYKYGAVATIDGNNRFPSNESWYISHYSRVTYSSDASTGYPSGITPIMQIFRQGADVTFTDYIVEVTLRDITEMLAIAPVEHLQAVTAHAVGDIFYLDDGNLYRATSQILQAGTITPGNAGNCTATTIAAELASLRAQLV